MRWKQEPSIKLLKYIRYVEEWSLREIGKLFGVSGEAVRKRMNKKKDQTRNKDKSKEN